MPILVIVAVVAGAAVVGVLGLAAAKPNVFRLTRSARIKAPPQAIYAYVADFRRWTEWSPWEDVDADLKRDYSGAASGVGAVYDWEGRKTGVGRMEITDAAAPRRLGIKLDFIKPFEAHNACEFSFEPADEAGVTAVTWSMQGPLPFMAKVMHVFMNMEKMVGPSFEKGLAKLKGLAEASPAA
ncbi:MAG: polyketide cyclase [Caulobacteraceae bacterium]|nr:polyketide cyclase [Caulobacteraceae bacterium]